MAKVTITLEFDSKPTKEDIYTYLLNLMEDNALDYSETKSLCSCDQYDSIGACDHT